MTHLRKGVLRPTIIILMIKIMLLPPSPQVKQNMVLGPDCAALNVAHNNNNEGCSPLNPI